MCARVCAKCRIAVWTRRAHTEPRCCRRESLRVRFRATEYVTSPPASPKQRLSGRVIHAKARPPRCSEHAPSLSSPSPLAPPDPCLRGNGVSRHREHLAPGHPPPLLSFLSPSPPHRPHWGVHNEVSHLHSGSDRKWSRPAVHSSCCGDTV